MTELSWTPRPIIDHPICGENLALDPNFVFAAVLRDNPALHPRLRKLGAAIGGTPIIQLPHEPGGASIFGKAEFLNAFGTVKARPAFALVLDDLRRDAETPCCHRQYLSYGGATFHIALMGVVRAIGASLTLYSATFLTSEQHRLLESQGAKLALVDKNLGFYAIVEAAVAAAAKRPDLRFLYQHLDRPALDIHYDTTGNELAHQLSELVGQGYRVAALVASIGTGGTLIGIARRLKESAFPSLQVFATTPSEQPYADPAPPNGATKFAGSGGFGFSRRQPFVSVSEDLLAGHFTVSYPASLAASAEFAELTGLHIGTSAAANWMAARQLARLLPPEAAVICVLPSLAAETEAATAREELSAARSRTKCSVTSCGEFTSRDQVTTQEKQL